MSKNIYSIESVMRTLENLTLGLDSFVITDADAALIKSKMDRCPKCRRWQFIENLAEEEGCSRCLNPSKIAPQKPKPKSHQKSPKPKVLTPEKQFPLPKTKPVENQSQPCSETIFVSVKASLDKGKTLREALFENAISSGTFQALPVHYKKTLFDQHNTHIALLAKK